MSGRFADASVEPVGDVRSVEVVRNVEFVEPEGAVETARAGTFRPGRVLFVNSICGNGSTGRLICGLMDELKARGVESLACYGRKTAPPDTYASYRVGGALNVCIHGALSRLTDRHGLYSAAATAGLIRKIEEYDPDIIHLHNLHGYYLNYRILFEYLRKAEEGRRRLVWTLHDCWSFTGHCTHYQFLGCGKWMEGCGNRDEGGVRGGRGGRGESGCGNCPQKDQYPRSFLLDASRSSYELKKSLFTGLKNLRLITPSEWLSGEVKKSFMKDYEVEVIPTGIDLGRFRHVESDLKARYGLEGKRVLLGVANPWRERKGLYEFIKLSAMLPGEYRIVMIGVKRAQRRLLPESITAIDHTESIEEMAGWYSLSDAFLNLTFEDTFPTTNLEALACGTPVITYDAGGSGESLSAGTGRVVRPGDLEEVVRAAVEFSGADRQALSGRCVQRAGMYSAPLRLGEYMKKAYGIE